MADGQRSLIQRTTVSAEAGAIGLVAVDWGPEMPGIQWVVATLDNGATVSGPTIEVEWLKNRPFLRSCSVM